MKDLVVQNTFLSTLTFCALIVAPGLSSAQSVAFPPLGHNEHCTPAARNTGQINMGGQTCATSFANYERQFHEGRTWANRCPSGYQLTGLANIQCTDITQANGRPQANYTATGCCALPHQAHSHSPGHAHGHPPEQSPVLLPPSLPPEIPAATASTMGGNHLAPSSSPLLATAANSAAIANVINGVGPVAAPPNPATMGTSWNLSRAIANAASSGSLSNPFGEMPGPGFAVWYALYDAVGTTLNPANYKPMPQTSLTHAGQPYANWNYHPSKNSLTVGTATNHISLGPYPYARGLPSAHPSPNNAAVVAWRSPINGSVRVLGRVTDVNYQCGDGVHWYFQRDGVTLQHGIVQSSGGAYIGSTLFAHTPVNVGTMLYFVVAPRTPGNHGCDTTALDVLIASD